MDTVGIEPEPVQEMVPEEEQGTVGIANEPVETALADGQLISQPPHTVQRGSFFDIGRFVVATGIADREPVGITNVFSSLTETVYCFLEARHITEDEAVNLAWYHEGSKMAEVELPLRKGQRDDLGRHSQHQGGPHPLHHPAGDEEGEAGAQTAETGGRGKHNHPGEKQPSGQEEYY